ncbi:MAG TPA: hypothetical protein VIM99_08125 [Blastocatellia bacterium]
MNQNDHDSIIKQVSHEGDPMLLLPPVAEIPAHDAVPPAWSRILTQPDAHKLVLSELWAPAQSFLPATVAALKKNLRGVALLLTSSRPPSLLYLFGREGDLYAHRGYAPAAALPDPGVALSADLLPFYQLHNGWVDFYSGDFGPYPISEWRRYGFDENGAGGFLNVFGNGGNALGFDLTDGESYALWTNDGEIEAVPDFWAELDGWIAEQIGGISDGE